MAASSSPAPRWLCLVSASPRRHELLTLLGLPLRVRPAHGVDETARPGESPAALVARLSRAKARKLADALAAEGERAAIVVAADTVVADGDTILGKPSSADEATAVLRGLRGRVHQVYTGVAAIDLAGRRLIADVAVTDVPMRAYSDEEIAAYVAGGDPFDKAGSYAIQHPGFRPVNGLTGCYANVMGLPLCHLTRILSRLGLPPPADVPEACRRFTGYDSPVAADILAGPAPDAEAYRPDKT
jgi:MAF protein